MAKGKNKTDNKKNKMCTSVFKNEILTKESYTKAWIELISLLERNRCKFSSSL